MNRVAGTFRRQETSPSCDSGPAGDAEDQNRRVKAMPTKGCDSAPLTIR
jgi:hypothetical protein